MEVTWHIVRAPRFWKDILFGIAQKKKKSSLNGSNFLVGFKQYPLLPWGTVIRTEYKRPACPGECTTFTYEVTEGNCTQKLTTVGQPKKTEVFGRPVDSVLVTESREWTDDKKKEMDLAELRRTGNTAVLYLPPRLLGTEYIMVDPVNNDLTSYGGNTIYKNTDLF